jgi:hypothetical protein
LHDNFEHIPVNVAQGSYYSALTWRLAVDLRLRSAFLDISTANPKSNRFSGQ